MKTVLFFLQMFSSKIPHASHSFSYSFRSLSFHPISCLSRSQLQEAFIRSSFYFRFWLSSYKKCTAKSQPFRYFDNLILHAVSVVCYYSALCRLCGRPLPPALIDFSLDFTDNFSGLKRLKGVS